MMKIANIVTEEDMDLGVEFNISKSYEGIIPTIPTLIVGCELTKSIFGDELDFMERKISDMIFWTFTKKEKRTFFHRDLEDFYQFVYEYSVSELKYVYIDLIHLQSASLMKIYRKIMSFDDIISYKHENMVYLYSTKLIFGLDLEMVSFVGLDTTKIINKIKGISKCFLEGKEVFIEYKNHMERLPNGAKFIPFFHSINHYE